MLTVRVKAPKSIHDLIGFSSFSALPLNCVRLKKDALLIQIGVEIVWDNVDWMQNGSWDTCLVSPADLFLQGRMTSSPTWQRRESLGLRSSNALPNL